MNKSIHTTTSILKGKNATEVDVNQPWELDNQAWWDWYVTLAETDNKFATNTKITQNFKNCRILSSNELKEELNTTHLAGEKPWTKSVEVKENDLIEILQRSSLGPLPPKVK